MIASLAVHREHDKLNDAAHHSARAATLAARPQIGERSFLEACRLHKRANRAKHRPFIDCDLLGCPPEAAKLDLCTLIPEPASFDTAPPLAVDYFDLASFRVFESSLATLHGTAFDTRAVPMDKCPAMDSAFHAEFNIHSAMPDVLATVSLDHPAMLDGTACISHAAFTDKCPAMGSAFR